jgi:hypothetical protein
MFILQILVFDIFGKVSKSHRMTTNSHELMKKNGPVRKNPFKNFKKRTAGRLYHMFAIQT